MSTNQIKTVLISIKNNLKIHVPNSTKFLSTYILLEQEDWFETEMGFIRQYIKPGMNVIDVGANFGLYTLNIAKCLDGQGQIFAFEPTPLTAEYLKLSIEENKFNNVSLHHHALSNFEGESTLFTNDNSELNSLSVQTKNSQRINIETTTLDIVMKRFPTVNIDFIKIDAEGEELNIIAGAHDFLKRQNPLIMFEYKHGSVINSELLLEIENYGYLLLRYIPGINILYPIYDKAQIDGFQLNLFCCNEQKFSKLIRQNLAVRRYSEQVDLPDNYANQWQKTLGKNLYPALIEQMKFSISSIAIEDGDRYMEAINYYCLATNSAYSGSDKLALLQLSFDILEKVIEQPTRIEYVLSYSRVALDLGYQSIAANSLNLLIESFQCYEKTQGIIPFIPTLDDNYQLVEDKPIVESIYVRTLENIEKLRSYSSYFLNGKDLSKLERLIKLGSQDCEILRRYQLVRMRLMLIDKFEYIPKLSVKSTNNLNPNLWPVDPSVNIKNAIVTSN